MCGDGNLMHFGRFHSGSRLIDGIDAKVVEFTGEEDCLMGFSSFSQYTPWLSYQQTMTDMREQMRVCSKKTDNREKLGPNWVRRMTFAYNRAPFIIVLRAKPASVENSL